MKAPIINTYTAESGENTATPLVPSFALIIICDTRPLEPGRKECVMKLSFLKTFNLFPQKGAFRPLYSS